MNTTLLRTLILFCLMLSNLTVIKAEEPTIPVITVPSNDNSGSHHNAPIHQDLYAVYNRIDHTLSLYASSSITISSVEIYKEGNLIVSDNIPTLYYTLSAYGNGNYSIQIITDDITYSGTFTIN